MGLHVSLRLMTRFMKLLAPYAAECTGSVVKTTGVLDQRLACARKLSRVYLTDILVVGPHPLFSLGDRLHSSNFADVLLVIKGVRYGKALVAGSKACA